MSAYHDLVQKGIRIRLRNDGHIGLSPARLVTREIEQFAATHKRELTEHLSRDRDRPVIARPKPRPSAQTHTRPTSKPATFPVGVGAEMRRLVPDFFKRSGCGCRDYAKHLDKQGIAWCEANQAEVIVQAKQRASEAFAASDELNPQTLMEAIGNAQTQLFAEVYKRWDHEITELPEGTAIVTAADQRFIAGLYLLCWTVLSHHRCEILCYDLGIDQSEMRDQLQSWGVRFIEPPDLSIPKGVPAWQIWNKPCYIRAAITDYYHVLWLDSDCAVGCSLSEAFTQDVFVPSHGCWNADANATREPITDLLGKDHQQWSGNRFPCAGIFGLRGNRIDILDEWIDRIRRVYAADLHQHCQYYDQTILQTFYAGDLQDGNQWSNFRCPRKGSEVEILAHLTQYNQIQHYGGNTKPFLVWDALHWPTPRGAQ